MNKVITIKPWLLDSNHLQYIQEIPSIRMSLVLENASFSQELTDTFQQNESDDLSFAGKRRRRLTRVSKNRPKGRKVYAKSGRALKGRYVRK